MEVVFKGKIRAFESTVGLNSSFGDVNLVARSMKKKISVAI
jgi:hypothetical protein